FVLIAFLFAISAFSVSPHLYAETINVPNDYPTIQQAVSVAVPGDTIKIKGGNPYLECVTISTNEIKLVGLKKGKKKNRPTILAYDCGGPAITISAGVTGVQIIGLTLRLSKNEGVLSEGGNDDTVIEDCYIVSNFDAGLKLKGNNMKVESCKILGNRLGGIDVEGSNNTIYQNQCVGSDAYGIVVTGDNNSIYKNSSLRNDETGITLSGDHNEVKSNDVMANAQDGIVFTGSSGNRIEGNVVRSNRGVGIALPADSNFNDIVKNKLSSGTDYGILIVSGEYNSVDRNEVNSFGNDGIRVNGSNKSIRLNKVQSIYNGMGISVEGDVNSITENEVLDCYGIGILYGGNGSILDSNLVRSCIIDVNANAIGVGGDDNVISNNVCSEISSHVIDVHGNSNTISDNYTSLSFSATGILVVGNKNVVGKDPDSPTFTSGNTSDGNNMDGIRVTGNKNLVSENVSTYNGHFGEHGFDIDGNENTIDGNTATGNIGDGINVYGDFNTISNNEVAENGIDGIDVDGDNGDRTTGDITHGGNVIDSNFAQLNTAEGIENNALSGAGGGGGTQIKNNTSQFNGTCDFAVSRRNPGDPVSDAVAPGSLNNISSDGSHEFTCAPLADSF
ncbi:MAG: right-handed parallel beta-helix repeat-containing protein, partial [Planctomycetes bacterium]|nr:right-handed parallel beta-helix repeat-containing protein [Planctomycetota bacterium]